MRKRLYEILDAINEDSTAAKLYNLFMMVTIFVSILPLSTKTENTTTELIDLFTVIIFIIDYILRVFTADFKLNQGRLSFIKYPFTFMAIVDLLSIIPSLPFIYVTKSLKMLKLIRLLRTLKVIRIFKSFRYSKNIRIIINVISKQKDSLITVGCLAIGYILVSALVIFNIEPETFNSFYDAVYWATVSLTTVGYGDIYTTTEAGRLITMFSALIGIAIVALPSGIITAGYMDEIAELKKDHLEQNPDGPTKEEQKNV